MGLITRQQGFVQKTEQDAAQLTAAGYHRCYTNFWKKNAAGVKLPCPFWLSPETVEMVKEKMAGYYTCPICTRSYNLLSDMEWHGVSYEEGMQNQAEDNMNSGFTAGGGTRIGLKLAEQGQIGEDLVEHLGEIPGYGKITWWHQGGAGANSSLDGATDEWGVEVKTIGYDAYHHRFVPGHPNEKADKNEMAEKMGKKGVLGVLVLLDYKRSVADIYVREYPLETGVGAFRSNTGQHLVKEVPFRNPLMSPHDPSPHVETGHSPFADEEMPF
jgi:hypothetical protein